MPSTASGDTESAPEPDASDRLAKLEELHEDDLIWDEEYGEKRSSIIEDI